MRNSNWHEESETKGTGQKGIGLGWDDKELRSKNHYIVCLFYGSSFIIALRRQINDNPEFSFIADYCFGWSISLVLWSS
jgi:hypothetical protein